MNTVPYSFQIKGARRIQRLAGRALLADEMGLGKTLQALLWLNRHPEALPAVVVCPASLKWNWEREAALHFNMPCEVLAGTKPPKLTAIRQASTLPLTVVNYDVLYSWLPYLEQLGLRTAILDECHYLINLGTRRTRAVRKLCRPLPHVIALSGTPLVNRPAELWPTLNILRPDLFPSFRPFGERYCRPRKLPWGWEFKGAANLDELHGLLLEHVMIRRLKSDVLKELPEQTRCVVPLELEDRKEYDEAERDFLSWLAKRDRGKARRAASAEQLTKMGYLKHLAGRLKLPSVISWVGDYLKDSGKLVVYACHTDVAHGLHEAFPRRSVLLDGGTPLRERQRAVEQFQKDPRTDLFVGNLQAAGVGINLTAAQGVAFAEMGWRPGDHSQAEKRIDRIGQQYPNTSYYLTARRTLEDKLAKILQDKARVINQTLDGGEGEELDVHTLLAQAMLKEQRGT